MATIVSLFHRFKGSPQIVPSWELIGLGLLLAIYLVADIMFGVASADVLNLIGPAWLTGVLGVGVVRMLVLDGGAVLTALCWFRVSVAVYFGGGALVPLLGTAETRAYLEAHYLFFSEEMEKLNVIVVVGCLTVLASTNVYHLFVRGRGQTERPPQVPQNGSSGRNLLAAGLFFLVLGGTVKYLFTVPQMLGLTDFVLPGAVGAIGNFTYAAVFFLTAWSYENAKGALPLVILFAAAELLVGILALTKTEVLTVLMMFLLGFLRRKVTLPRLGLTAGIMLLCYLAVQPIIDEGRAEQFRRYAGYQGGDLSERLDMLRLALNTPSGTDTSTGSQPYLVRISYVTTAVFAVRQYDSGHPGDSLALFLSVFVPRFLWPDKPIITQTGIDFNFAATGIASSASSPGLFAEAYWNFGWPGVVLLMMPYGIILGALTDYTLTKFHLEQWLYFPVVILGMRIGFRTDGFYVADVAGGLVILICLHIALKLFERFVLPILRPAIAGI
jgi:hypothetical protein